MYIKVISSLVGFLFIFPSISCAQALKSTLNDQKNIAITIYNNNLGLVKDIRTIKLENGVQDLQFMDVANQINPVTVHIKSLTSPDKLKVLEQNYEYDLLNSSKLLDKFVGKTVKIVEKNQFKGEEKTYTAEVLSNNNGPIFKIGNEIHISAPGSIIFPEIPENLMAKPTLVWMLENKNPDEQEIEASYLTNGIGWKADYIAVVNNDDTKGDLSGWVTINNNSGATYNNALIKLVAGEVNRIKEPRSMQKNLMFETAVASDAQGFQEESFFEYHLYTLQRLATIKENQIKQIELLSANDFPIKQRLIYYGAEYYFRNRNTGQMTSNEKIGVFLEIQNKKENNLGMPLPAGTVRVYKNDREGSLQFIGEDRLKHTPKDETIKLKMGNAFDVVAERKQTDYRILSKNASQNFDCEQEWQITLRNHKEKPATVEIYEPIPGDWDIISSNTQFSKDEAHTIKFNVELAKDETKTVIYRVRIRYY